MRFGVLGPLAAWTDEGREVRVPEVKVRALLADLIIHSGRVVSVDRLIDDLWGDALPGDPSNTLQTKVSQLRRVLGGAEAGGRGLVVYRAPGYLLKAEDLDAARFTALVARARAAGDPYAKTSLLADALALWRGPAYGEFRDEPFARHEAAALEELRLTALEEQAEARLATGDHALLADGLAPAVADHPMRERLRAAHLKALYLSGRQGEALALYDQLRNTLADELGVDPSPALTTLHLAMLNQDPALGAASPPAALGASLPAPLSGIIGREAETDRARRMLASGRLLTVTGPGGAGKTRLAVAVAAAAAGDRARFVELADLRTADPDRVAEHVAAALGLRDDAADRPAAMPRRDPAERLAEVLRGRDALLVLDNCEHLVEPAAELTHRLLTAVPDLRVIVTSRESLAVPGETLLPLGPLSPDAAAELYESRAQTAPGPADAPWIRAACERLDGLPLALELAAARVRALGYRGVAERLDDRFSLLSNASRGRPDRQRTLRAVIDWSWEQLDDDQRRTLSVLAVHPGGAAPGVPDADPDLVEQLVARSMAVAEPGPDGTMRYRLLESIAAYGRERLAETGDAAAVLDRRDDHYARLVEQADLRGPAQEHWLRRLDQEERNLLAAAEHRADPGLTVRLSWYWYLRGRHGEALRHLAAVRHDPEAAAWEHAFALLTGTRPPVGDAKPDPQVGPRADWFLASAHLHLGDPDAAGPLLGRALDECRATDDAWGEAAVLASGAKRAIFQGDLSTAERAATGSLHRFTALGDRWGRLQAGDMLAYHAEITGDYEHAARLHRDGLRSCEALGMWIEASYRLSGLGRIALLTGDLAESERLHERGRAMAAEHGAAFAEDFARMGLALAARRRGALDTAESLLEASLDWGRRLRSASGKPFYGVALTLSELGFVAELRGDARQARLRHGEALDAAEALGDPRAIALAEEGLAGAAALDGNGAEAERLLSEAAALRASLGAPLPPAERGDVDRIEARLRAAVR
ncbi:winged helix-turn-helix domain-containing protein [Glycomyces sp. TRM65418]|uniref:BTAD domain-containing putative transcriptional regulator n=1 Tax=Glycomyces sp. TRM65418 TaxID=2867006 RepID=UPI001CE7084E|nr:BTAD domain-containing putative transcriptional regulator [Glycomyces sp. TRM65418]MCC3765941.1 winged helix-turn-helix domain-containing protein [Glycomyces sp. TRM65418]QZD55523.1 winged helix-turn-helix domain-containing protein [Glycomyces sp. TRM65418]